MGSCCEGIVAMFDPHPSVRRSGYIGVQQVLGELVAVAPAANCKRQDEIGENARTEKLAEGRL